MIYALRRDTIGVFGTQYLLMHVALNDYSTLSYEVIYLPRYRYIINDRYYLRTHSSLKSVKTRLSVTTTKS